MRQFFRKDRFPLRKEIAVVIIVKLIAIFILWYFWFSHPVKDHLTTRVMQQHISGKHGGSLSLPTHESLSLPAHGSLSLPAQAGNPG